MPATPGAGVPTANVVLVHYDNLLADVDGQMRRLAEILGIAAAASLRAVAR